MGSMYPYMSKPKQDISIDVPQELIKDLLTESEWRMIKQRLLIMKFLEEGLTIRAVAEKVKVGTDTVVRVSKKLHNSPLLRQIFKQNKSPVQASKWIFGQSGKKVT